MPSKFIQKIICDLQGVYIRLKKIKIKIKINQDQGALKRIFKILNLIGYPESVTYSKCNFEKSYFPLENIYFNILRVKNSISRSPEF